MQLTRATNGGLVWERNRSVIKDPNRLLIFSRQFYKINDSGLLEPLADEVNFVPFKPMLFCFAVFICVVQFEIRILNPFEPKETLWLEV